MSAISLVVDTSVFEERMTALEKSQLPFARLLASNEAAFNTRQTLQKSMSLYLDRPTPYTVRSVRYTKGTKQRPAAEIFINPDDNKGTAPAKYLRSVVRGGVRRQRRSERVLARAGLISLNEGWVPATKSGAVRLNRYGNLTGAKITQLLSSIKAFGEQGFTANVTKKSRARKPGKAKYFVARGSSKLARGIYERTGRGGRGVRPVLLFVPLPSYSVGFDFDRLAGTEARRRFLAAWPAAFRRALATAR